jgi:hypothetical protein
MHSSCLPAPRAIDPLEGEYSPSEVAGSIASTVAELLEDLEWSLSTLAAAEGLTAAQAAVGGEIRCAAHRVAHLAQLLQAATGGAR